MNECNVLTILMRKTPQQPVAAAHDVVAVSPLAAPPPQVVTSPVSVLS